MDSKSRLVIPFHHKMAIESQSRPSKRARDQIPDMYCGGMKEKGQQLVMGEEQKGYAKARDHSGHSLYG